MAKRSGGSNGGGTNTNLPIDYSGEAASYYIAGSGSYYLNNRGKKVSASNATSNPDTILGGSGNDTVYGLAGNDTINGGGGNDHLYGEAGDDSLDGAAGNDLIAGGAGNDAISGGDDVDTVSYQYAQQGVAVDLGNLLLSSTFNAVVNDSDSDTLTGIENIIGSDYSDTLTGDINGNRIDGGGAADTINGADGDDTLSGANGQDEIYGGAGNDLIFGDNGGTGDSDGDLLFGDAGMDTIYGNNGSDYLDGGEDADYLFGGNGSDTIVYDLADTSVDGGDGTDTLDASNAGGSVTIDLGSVGSQFSNFEIIIGGSSADDLTGDDGDNAIDGSADNDTINGNAGNDTLVGGPGNDSIDGGNGIDTVDYSGADVLLTMNLLTPSDTGITLALNGATAVVVDAGGTDVGSDQIVNVENIIGTSAKDALTGDGGDNIISAGAGNDTIAGGGGADTLNGDADNDTLTGGVGADTLSGGDGDDRFLVAGTGDISSDESYDGGANSDTLAVTADTDFTGVSALTAVETISADASVDLIFDAAALTGDTIAVNGSGDDGSETLTVNGTSNADDIDLGGLTLDTNDIAGTTINAGAGADTVTGTNGDDILNGGDGADEIDGGAGADLVSLVNISSAGDADEIYSFTSGSDVIALTNTTGGTSGTPATALITVGGLGFLTITGIIADTATNLAITAGGSGAIGNQTSVFTSGGYAYETDTGNLYFDADGDFTTGIVLVGTLYSTASGGADTPVVAIAGDFQFGI